MTNAETPILWPPDAKSWLIGKDPDAGKDWRQEEKGMTEDEKVGWYHWLSGHGFGWIPGVGGGQGGLACCGSWGRKQSDMTEWLNWTIYLSYFCVNKFEKWLKNIHLFIFHFNNVLTYQTTHSLNIDLFWIYVTSLMLSDRD